MYRSKLNGCSAKGSDESRHHSHNILHNERCEVPSYAHVDTRGKTKPTAADRARALAADNIACADVPARHIYRHPERNAKQQATADARCTATPAPADIGHGRLRPSKPHMRKCPWAKRRRDSTITRTETWSLHGACMGRPWGA